MKGLLPLTAGLAFALIQTSGASATTLSTRGNEFTNACYEAASLGRADGLTISRCTRALVTEATTGGADRAATLVNRGILYMLAGKSASATRDFDEALALNPLESEAWLGKALEAWKAGNDRNALSFANQALALRTHKPAVAYYVRGLANEALGNVRAAYRDLQQARALAPQWAEPTQQLARYRVVRR
jgi:tetratricopeptide (TPR) repeat protein